VHFPAPHHPQNPAVHLRPRLVTARLLEVLLVDTVVLHPEGVALEAEEEEVQTTTHTFHARRIRDRDHQDLDVEGADGHTLIRDRLRGHRQGGEAQDHHHHQGVRQGGDGEAQATAPIAAIARVGVGAGLDP
jgi:hypothetical protein